MAGQTRRKSGQLPKVQVRQAIAGTRVAVSTHCEVSLVGNGTHRQDRGQEDPTPPWCRTAVEDGSAGISDNRRQRMNKAIGITSFPCE